MNTRTSIIGYDPRTKSGWFYLGAIAIAMTASLGAGCGGGGGGSSGGSIVTLSDPNPIPAITGTSLYCADPNILYSNTAANYEVAAPDSIPTYNLSKDTGVNISGQPSELRANAGNTIKRLSAPVVPMTADLTPVADPSTVTINGDTMVHPILVSYTEQVIGTYELGDGSADIGDPYHIDDAFVSLSLDNGKSYKKVRVGDSSGSSSIQVTWDNALIDYPGHSHKMTLATQGNYILAAWLDKYCPSGNPYNLEDPTTEDTYKVNGSQGSIDYALPCTITDPEDLNYNCAPNGKPVYEVPFSCVWAARGVFDPDTGVITWRKGEQMTSGVRDANKIGIAPAAIGWAMVWQEDPEGLRAGKGAGPGEGWSGATTNHGADIWYTYITMTDFDDVIVDDMGDTDPTNDVVSDDPTVIAGLTEKAKPAVPFTYPVRVTDNAPCNADGDTKLYCDQVCTGSTQVESNNQSGDSINRCITGDHDPLEDDASIYATLDGDTGASRPAVTILRTNADEFITVLAYEETKGLSETEPGVPDDPTATDIAVEGKIVLTEGFFWDDPVTISAGNIVNVKVPRFDPATGTFDSGDMIYENARRVVIVKQVDACEMTANSYPIGFLYKQSFETRGGPSDMFIRLGRGLTPDTLETVIYNVSAQSTTAASAQEADIDLLTWDLSNLDDYVGENPYDNTFSPRAFMRGDEIYTGFAYTPADARTVSGQVASNFWIHRNLTGAANGWLGPQQISFEKGGTSALDPRFKATAKYNANGVTAGIASDRSNPDVLMISYGTADASHELDVYYSRSTDKGETWEYVVTGDGVDGIPDTADDDKRFAKLSSWPLPVEEKEVQLLASPDGNMGFNVWLQESECPPDVNELPDTDIDCSGVNIPNRRLGLESWLGRVDWVDPTAP